MAISRRLFIQGAAAGFVASNFGLLGCAKAKSSWFVSACSDKAGQHYVAAFDLAGNVINQIALPARGHDAIALPHKPGHAMVFARRPGMFALEVDFVNARVVKQVTPENDSHFYGHGVYWAKHHVILTSENYFSTGEGQIVVRDADSYQQLARYYSGGIGPHEIALMPDNETLVIANGGIKTHPDMPRQKLNLDTMDPNLAYMSLLSGKVLESYQLDNKQLSIRHLDVSQSGKVIAGLQYQGAKTDLVPLVISHSGESQLTPLSAEDSLWRQMNHYTASICVDDDNQLVAVSCPRADLITLWSLADNRFISKHKLADGAGLTKTDQLYASSGKGYLTNEFLLNAAEHEFKTRFTHLKWDNHLTHIQAV
ncbi:hypothetical protein tinsulaeT_21980 [Thalassotalea insulae]|uniref:DUF1513 domain-containing protein n=1 Tax=Thalassotalea insulae TaxID=2056778 RepID=A0ABQ6GSE1_9GAMM|nr:DUF1513 domain-containing protein [Thalassotalea insulae]GLX78858.1 hypothetical protein tinsulaeT_21980 [Thalassotalea insulae]